MKKCQYLFFVFLLAGLLLATFCGVAGQPVYGQESRTVSGNISLPEGVTAAEELTITVNVFGRKTGVDAATKVGETEVSLVTGENNVVYTITVDQGADSADGYLVYYEFTSNNYVNLAYYAESDGSAATTTYVRSAKRIDIREESISGIDLELISGRKISGKITTAEAPAENLSLSLYARDDEAADALKSIVYKGLVFRTGESETAYEVVVPVNAADSGYTVYYEYSGEDYVQTAYYNTEGTATTRGRATKVDVSSDGREDIDLELIPGRKISGSVRLPADATLLDSNASININARLSGETRDLGSTVRKTVTLPAGERTVDYSFVVPMHGAGAGYHISYYYVSDSFMNEAYYSTSGTVTLNDHATRVNVLEEAQSEIDLRLIPGRRVSGKLGVLEGVVVPEDGITAYLVAEAYSTSRRSWSTINYQRLTIRGGTTERSYNMMLPYTEGDNRDYRISYLYDGDAPIIQKGFYLTRNRTSWYGGQGYFTEVNLAEGALSNINLYLLGGNQISGSVSLPAGVTAPDGDVSVTLYADAKTASGWLRDLFSTTVTIPAGRNASEYVITCQPNRADFGYRLRYVYSGTEYVRSGFYNTEQTTPFRTGSELVDVSTAGQSGVDIDLIPGHTISGRLNLPAGMTAPEGGISANIAAMLPNEADQREYVVSMNITITEGNDSVPYTLVVPAESDYRVDYYLSPAYSGNDLLLRGYYAAAGTTADGSKADSFHVQENKADMHLTLLSSEKEDWPGGSRDDVEPGHNFRIKFNKEVNAASVTPENIIVVDANGNPIITGGLDTQDDEVVVSAPQGGYQPGQTYYLYIMNLLNSEDEEVPLRKSVRLTFRIKS